METNRLGQLQLALIKKLQASVYYAESLTTAEIRLARILCSKGIVSSRITEGSTAAGSRREYFALTEAGQRFSETRIYRGEKGNLCVYRL